MHGTFRTDTTRIRFESAALTLGAFICLALATAYLWSLEAVGAYFVPGFWRSSQYVYSFGGILLALCAGALGLACGAGSLFLATAAFDSIRLASCTIDVDDAVITIRAGKATRRVARSEVARALVLPGGIRIEIRGKMGQGEPRLPRMLLPPAHRVTGITLRRSSEEVAFWFSQGIFRSEDYVAIVAALQELGWL